MRGARATVLVIPLAAVAVLVAAAVADPRRAAFAWLFAFTYAAGLGVASSILLATLHVTGARWVVVVRRPLECVAGASVSLFPLFLPVAIAVPMLYSWAGPAPLDLAAGKAGLLLHKQRWLNEPFFYARSGVYLSVWMLAGAALFGLSLGQDRRADPSIVHRLRLVAAPALPLLGLTTTFAAFDWLLSLDPFWTSTIFGVYWFAGSFLSAICVLTLVTAWAYRRRDSSPSGSAAREIGSRLGPGHLHALGNLLFGFTVFWAYIAFCQYMLIWIADLPEEAAWYVARTRGDWATVRTLLFLAHFVAPFLLLLPRAARRHAAALTIASVWLLGAHALDLWWVVIPAMGAVPPVPHAADPAALLVAAGAILATARLLMGLGRPVPLQDPALAASIRFGAS